MLIEPLLEFGVGVGKALHDAYDESGGDTLVGVLGDRLQIAGRPPMLAPTRYGLRSGAYRGCNCAAHPTANAPPEYPHITTLALNFPPSSLGMPMGSKFNAARIESRNAYPD